MDTIKVPSPAPQLRVSWVPESLAHGHNKDHRPDLKQLVLGMSASADRLGPKISLPPRSCVTKRGRFLLAVQGVGGDQGALARHFTQQGFDGGNLVALFLDGFLGHGQTQAVRNGREQLERLATERCESLVNFNPLDLVHRLRHKDE